MKITKHSLNFLCLAASVYHIYRLSEHYFQYGVISVVIVKHPEKIVPPLVSFRIDMQHLIRWENMKDDIKMRLLTCNNTLGIYREYGECAKLKRTFVFEKLDQNPRQLLSSSFLTSLVGNSTWNEDFYSNILAIDRRDIDDITLDFSDVFHDVELAAVVTVEKNADPRDISKSYLHMNTSLSTFSDTKEFQFHPIAKKAEFSYISVMSHNEGRLYSFPFKRNMVYSHGLKYVKMNLCPSGFQNCFGNNMIVHLKYLSEFTYDEYRYTRLPPPYVTKCRNYTEESFSHRDDCYETCVQKAEEQHWQSYVSNKTWMSCNQDCYKNLHQCTGQYTSDRYSNDKEQFYKCDEKVKACRESCSTEDPWESQRQKYDGRSCTISCQQQSCFDVMLSPRKMLGSKEDDWDFISIYAPHTPVISTVTGEEITLSTFLTNIGSSLGFWLGLSAIGIAERLCRNSTLLFHFLRKTEKRTIRKTTSPSCGCDQDILTLQTKVRILDTQFKETRYLLSHISDQIRQQNQIIRQLCQTSNLRVYRHNSSNNDILESLSVSSESKDVQEAPHSSTCHLVKWQNKVINSSLSPVDID